MLLKTGTFHFALTAPIKEKQTIKLLSKKLKISKIKKRRVGN